MTARLWQGYIALGIVLVYPVDVLASDSEDTTLATARSLGFEGLDAWDRGDLPTALDRLNRAYRIHPVPTLALWTGRVLEQMGRLVEASERWLEASRMTVNAADEDREIQLQAVEDAARARAAMLRRIPKLLIAVEGGLPADAELSVDGNALAPSVVGAALPLNPGEHEIILKWSGPSVTERAHLVEGRTTSVLLATGVRQKIKAEPSEQNQQQPSLPAPLMPIPAYRASDGEVSRLQYTLGWVTLGLGAVGLATWGITGAIALDRHDALQEHCKKNVCSTAYQGDLDTFRRYRTVSTIGFIVGATGAVAGTTLVLTATRRGKSGRVVSWHGWFSPSGIGVGASY